MGLLSKLTTIGEGSTLSFSDGETPFTNPLSTKESQLHYNTAEDKPGYSVTGTQFSMLIHHTKNMKMEKIPQYQNLLL
jgi:hypothetical protein